MYRASIDRDYIGIPESMSPEPIRSAIHGSNSTHDSYLVTLITMSNRIQN